MPKSTVRPLLVRPGARHACAGDGLCCTDAHVLGPVTPAEAARARAVFPDAITRSPKLRIAAMRTVGHDCVFLDAEGCRLHREHGAAYKPATCRHFPVAIVATPQGGRVTTDHRCPCRTMGERPLLDEGAALAALTAGGERLAAHARAGARISVSLDRRVSFARYVRDEAAIFDALDRGTPPEEALAAEPFPALDGATWADVAHHLRALLDGSSAGDGLAWAGDAMLALLGVAKPALRARPWAPAFDRAEARSREGDPEAILVDWVKDELWALGWVGLAPFDAARAAIATQLAVARWVAARLVAAGARSDRAAAEAVLVGELCGRAPLWSSVLRQIA